MDKIDKLISKVRIWFWEQKMDRINKLRMLNNYKSSVRCISYSEWLDLETGYEKEINKLLRQIYYETSKFDG